MKKIIVLLFAILLSVNPILATPASFYVRSEIPPNQVDKNQTYFDLRLSPNYEQTIYLELINPTNEDINLNISLKPATTGRDGIIIYTQDYDFDLSITDVAKLSTETISVPANSSEYLTIDIKMPDLEFDGVLLGGISVSLENDDDTQAPNGINISNNYVYVTALKITQNDNIIAPDFTFNGVEAKLTNYSTSFVFNLENTEAKIINNARISAQVYKNGTPVKEYNNNYAQFAPNTSADFLIDWDGERIDNGTYKFNISIEYDNTNWHFSKELTIGEEDVENINQNYVSAEATATNLTFVFTITLLIILIILFLIIQQVKKKKRLN